MKFAIKILATGEIIRAGESLESLFNHIRVNPTHIIVWQSKGKWIEYKGSN